MNSFPITADHSLPLRQPTCLYPHRGYKNLLLNICAVNYQIRNYGRNWKSNSLSSQTFCYDCPAVIIIGPQSP